jgi:hypothetical protein
MDQQDWSEQQAISLEQRTDQKISRKQDLKSLTRERIELKYLLPFC